MESYRILNTVLVAKGDVKEQPIASNSLPNCCHWYISRTIWFQLCPTWVTYRYIALCRFIDASLVRIHDVLGSSICNIASYM